MAMAEQPVCGFSGYAADTGLPLLLMLRPRPDMGYNATTQLGIAGDNRLFLQYLLVQYNTVSTD